MTETTEKRPNAGRLRSISKIVDALLSLLREKGYNNVTVTEVCERADVARKTFYRSFDSKDAVIEHCLDALFKALSDNYDLAVAGAQEMITFCFEYLERDRALAEIFLDTGLYALIVGKMVKYIELAYDKTLHDSASFEPAYADYYHGFIAVGFMSIIHAWVDGGFKQSVPTLVSLTRRLLSGVIT